MSCYFMLKALFVIKIFTFLSSLFSYVEQRLDKKGRVNFKIHDVTDWKTNNCNAYIAQFKNQAGRLVPDVLFFL